MENPILKKPFFLGKLKLSSNIWYAPLAGCSDYPFRQLVNHFRPGLFFCEMVKIDALVRSDKTTLRMLDFDPSMHPIGAQICGTKPDLARQAARMVEEMGFDVLDLNCGCPVDKVTKDGSGSGMLKNPELIGEILSACKSAVSIPLTVKIRAGWDDDSIVVEDVVKIAEEAGAVAITVHGRTREQAYRGPANWEYIKRAKNAAKNILVIGNGDLYDGPSVEKMHQETGCDGFLIARGTMGTPWALQQIEEYFAGKTPSEFSVIEWMRKHYTYIAAYQPERQAILDMRRVGCWYAKQLKGARHFRGQISQATSLEEVERLLVQLESGLL